MLWDNIESPLELARQLWAIDNLDAVRQLPKESFQSLFDRVYLATNEIEALWQLAGAANDYLRFSPDSINVPPELPRRLLSSNHSDARIVGLKLLNRCHVSDEEIVDAIIRALNRDDESESCSGINELGNYLGRRLPAGVGIDGKLIDRLVDALEPLVDDGVDLHSAAPRVLGQLKDIRAES